MLNDEKPKSLKIALKTYQEALEDESAEQLREEIKKTCHYVIDPALTYTQFAEAANNNSFVDNFEKEEEIDFDDLLSEMERTDEEIEKSRGGVSVTSEELNII